MAGAGGANDGNDDDEEGEEGDADAAADAGHDDSDAKGHKDEDKTGDPDAAEQEQDNDDQDCHDKGDHRGIVTTLTKSRNNKRSPGSEEYIELVATSTTNDAVVRVWLSLLGLVLVVRSAQALCPVIAAALHGLGNLPSDLREAVRLDSDIRMPSAHGNMPQTQCRKIIRHNVSPECQVGSFAGALASALINHMLMPPGRKHSSARHRALNRSVA